MARYFQDLHRYIQDHLLWTVAMEFKLQFNVIQLLRVFALFKFLIFGLKLVISEFNSGVWRQSDNTD